MAAGAIGLGWLSCPAASPQRPLAFLLETVSHQDAESRSPALALPAPPSASLWSQVLGPTSLCILLFMSISPVRLRPSGGIQAAAFTAVTPRVYLNIGT